MKKTIIKNNPKIGLIGIAGKMGREIAKVILSNKESKLAGGLENSKNIHIGTDIGDLLNLRKKLNILVTDVPDEFFKDLDVVIEFSSPSSTIENIKYTVDRKIPFVSGTTGLGSDVKEKIKEASKKIPILWAPNMSIGANVVISTVKNMVKELGEKYDVEIIEHHHRFKKDAPSGTAIALGKAVSEGLKKNFDKIAKYGRESNSERKKGEIGFASTRGGDSIGEHTVVFFGDGDRIELKHVSTSRKIFAEGAVAAALWINNKNPGLYSITDLFSNG